MNYFETGLLYFSIFCIIILSVSFYFYLEKLRRRLKNLEDIEIQWKFEKKPRKIYPIKKNIDKKRDKHLLINHKQIAIGFLEGLKPIKRGSLNKNQKEYVRCLDDIIELIIREVKNGK